MRVAVLGPLCKDEIIRKGKSYYQLGGAVYYISHALACLGVKVIVFASYGKEDDDFLKGFKYHKLVHIPAEKTIKFINEYPDKNNLDNRVQRAEIYKNEISLKSLYNHDLNKYDFIILAPLFHDNFSLDTIKGLSLKKGKLVLAGQGMIRYLDKDKIIWKNPKNIINTFPYINYLLLDENELEFLTKHTDIHKGARFLQTKRIENLIVTRASKGSFIFLRDKTYEIRAFPPKPHSDSTGAGDSYLAGFIKALELFDNPVKQGEFAAMIATIAIENKGAFNKTLDEVYERLK